MFKTKETRESLVISILGSAKKIEKRIIQTFEKKVYDIKRHPSVRVEQMPIFVSFLYDQIINNKVLPTQEQFVDAYMEEYYEDVTPDQLIYKAYIERTAKAYPSLVRDLHFYLKLKESRKFTDVQLSYAYDIEAKQDIVVTLGEKKLGLQLFNGRDAEIEKKRKQAERRRISLNYPDFYLPLHGSMAHPVNIGNKPNDFFVYSDADVDLVYQQLKTHFKAELKKDRDETYVMPEIRKMPVKSNTKMDFHHSYLFIGKTFQDWNSLKELLQRGSRVEVIVAKTPASQDLHFSKEEELLKKNLRIHHWSGAGKHQLEVIDGEFTKQIKELLHEIGENSSFNYEQYITEHAGQDGHLIVEAGAGSGKTETMISRILFLLHLGFLLNLNQIVMITFTNEAANSMRTKLTKRLYELFEITHDIRYIDWIEQVTSMRILTIPSFAKSVLQDFSTHIGMGKNFKVRNLTMDRREIISEALADFIRTNKLSFEDLGKIREYEWGELIENFWVQLEQKGLTQRDLEAIIWGNQPKGKSELRYHRMLRKVLSDCIEKFDRTKLEQDAVTVGDLTQKLNDIYPFLDMDQLSEPFDYLFVDEFQDTDDIQINLVERLSKITCAQLFVVGDIKQSIYRFRGANYTAFDVLCKKLGKPNVNREFKLRKNYRTTEPILEEIENMFDVWRNHPDEILPKGTSSNGSDVSRLRPTFLSDNYLKQVDINSVYSTYKYDVKPEINGLYRTLNLKDKKEDKPMDLAILVRTNAQANRLREILESMRETDRSIHYEVVTGGNLFSSNAARDLLILLNAFCYEKDPESFYALCQTPFANQSFEYVSTLIDYEGDRNRISIDYQMVSGFEDAMNELRLMPPIHVIYQFLSRNPYVGNLAGFEEQSHIISKYKLNLYRILELAGEGVGTSNVSIQQLCDWLKNQVATNRNEDEMEADITEYDKIIKVITVHKAKGLEFDTVFIPYTYHSLNKKTDQEMLVTKEDDVIRAGWKVEAEMNSKKVELYSTLYDELKENESKENIREEARLLYVALTRAQHRLVVRYDEPKKIESIKYWADLIHLGRRGGK